MSVQIKGDTGDVVAVKGTYSGQVSGKKLVITSDLGQLGVLTSTTSDSQFDIFDDDTQTRIRTVDGRCHISADHRNAVADSSIRFIVDGTNQASIDGNGHIFFFNDPDTYFHRPQTNTLAFDTQGVERVRIESGGNVGIGTSNPNNLLHVYGGQIKAQTSIGNTSTNVDLIRAQSGSGGGALFSIRAADAADDNSNWDIKTNSNEDLSFTIGAGSEKARILSSGGLTFGGDTAAANALNDYEEGDWTPSLSLGSPTYATQVGKYTKIGELVLCSFYLDYSNGADSSQRIAGLPFAPDATREAVNQVSRLGGAFNEGASQGSRAVHSISFTSQGTTRIYVDLIINVAARGIRGTFMYRAA